MLRALQFGGQFIWKANPAIVEKLSEVGALMHSETIAHSYMHCWRHKSPLIYRATAQWFVGMDKQPVDGQPLRERALKAIEDVRGETRALRDRCLHTEDLLRKERVLMETFRQLAYRRGADIPEDSQR